MDAPCHRATTKKRHERESGFPDSLCLPGLHRSRSLLSLILVDLIVSQVGRIVGLREANEAPVPMLLPLVEGKKPGCATGHRLTSCWRWKIQPLCGCLYLLYRLRGDDWESLALFGVVLFSRLSATTTTTTTSWGARSVDIRVSLVTPRVAGVLDFDVSFTRSDVT